MRLQFVGCGDAFGTGGRFNTCFHVTHEAGSFLIDCGATSMVALKHAGIDPNAIDAIFITHLHGDHFGGLPFFLLDARHVSRRAKPLTIVGPSGLSVRLKSLFEALYPGSAEKLSGFDLALVEIAPGDTHGAGPVHVAAFEMSHPSGAPSLGLRLTADGKTIAYTGDTAWCEHMTPLGRDADLFICECSSFAQVLAHHLNYQALCKDLPSVGARRVVLTHFGPEMMANLHNATAFELAHDGLAIEI